MGTRVNPDGYVWAGEFDLNTLRVDGEIFESGKKKLRIQKYPDMCGRSLRKPLRQRQRERTKQQREMTKVENVKHEVFLDFYFKWRKKMTLEYREISR